MQNDFSFPSFSHSSPVLATLLLLVLALILSACNDPDKDPSPDTDGLNEIALGGLEGAAGRFITACLAGNWATALDLLVPETREAILSWGGGNPCSQVSADPDSAAFIPNERAGNTAYMTFEWPAQDSDGIVEYQLLLTEIDEAWFIFDDHKTRQRPSPIPITPTPTIAPPGIAPTQANEGGG